MKNPPESVTAVISTDEPTAGSRPRRSIVIGISTPAMRGEPKVQRHREHHDEPERYVAIEQRRDHAHHAAPDEAVEHRDLQLLADQVPAVLAR